MEQRITQWLQSHRHAEYFKAQMLANTEYTEIAEYVEETPRCFVIEQALDCDERKDPELKAELQADYKAFLREFAIDNVKEYRERKIARYKPFRVTKQCITDIIDYCVFYGLTQNETSRLLDSAIHLVEHYRDLTRPSKAAFAITVLWAQAWQDRMATPIILDRLTRYRAINHLGYPMLFKEFDAKFRELVNLAKQRHYDNETE